MGGLKGAVLTVFKNNKCYKCHILAVESAWQFDVTEEVAIMRTLGSKSAGAHCALWFALFCNLIS